MTRKNCFYLRVFALAACAAVCGGCIPYHYTDMPGVKGRVLDARTHAPIPAAKVRLSAEEKTMQETLKTRETTTAANGYFLIPAGQHWGILPLVPMDYFPSAMRVDFSAAGYNAAFRKFHSGFQGPGMTDLGTVEMKK